MTALRPVVILGGASGAIAAEAIYDIAAAGGALVCGGYLNDVLTVGTEIGGHKVLGPFDAWADLPPETMFFAVLHKAKEAPRRMERIAALGIPDDRWAILQHPAATVARQVPVGPGSYVGPHATVMTGAKIGRHCSLRPGCSIGHDTALGDFVFVGPNATLNGNCSAGDGVHIGPNATVHEETGIGDGAVVGMGSVVLQDVPPRTLVVGNPARATRRYDRSGERVPVGA